MSIRYLIIALVISLTSCSIDSSDPELEQSRRQFSYYDEVPLKTLMNAELAVSREKYDLAANNYLGLAKYYRNSYLAMRSTQIAIMTGNLSTAVEAAPLWAEWAPFDNFPQYLSIILQFNAKKTSDTQHYIDNILIGNENQAWQTLSMIIEELPDNKSQKIFLADMQNLEKKYPQNLILQLSLAKLALQLNQHKLALYYVNKVSQRNPLWTDAIGLRLQILIAMNQKDEAIRYIQNLVEKNPQISALEGMYADLLLQLRQLTEAKQKYEKLLRSNKEQGKALIMLGQLAEILNHPDEAKQYFTQALTQEHNATQAHYFLGVLEQKNQNYLHALEWYSGILSGPYYIKAQMNSARIFAVAGKPKEALFLLDKLALPTLEQLRQVLLLKAQILLSIQEPKKALTILSTGVRLMPENIELLFNRSMIAEKLKLINLAVQDLKHIIHIDPNNTNALNALGYILLEQTNQVQEAKKYLFHAYTLSPNDPAIIDSLGWFYYRTGETTKALQFLQKAYSMNNAGEIAAHFGEILWQTGNKEKARMIWQEGLIKSPDDEILKKTIDNHP